MSIQSTEVMPDHFGFLLVPNYSMLAFTSAVEPLRMANRATQKSLYKWTELPQGWRTLKNKTAGNVRYMLVQATPKEERN